MKTIIKALIGCIILSSCSSPDTNTSPPTATNEESTNIQNETNISKPTEEPLPSSLFFPSEFRSWRHVKSMVLQKGHPLFDNFGGIHHIYANEKAMEGYKNKSFPDGSVIVFDLFEAIEKDAAITEGNRKVIGVMYKNSSIFSETGGWVFGGFKNMSGEQIDLDWKAQCFSCHTSQKDNDYVFSSYRE